MRPFAILVLLCLFALPARAIPIQEVTSPHGIKAWLIEDHKMPIVSMSFAFRGGLEQDPADKQGLAILTMDLLTEGAGHYNATAFQQALADRSITLGFNAGRDALQGNVKFLKENQRDAFRLLGLALTRPHFDAAEITRAKAQQLTALRSQFADPDWQARYALLHLIFDDHPYSYRRLGTEKTVAAITRNDIRAFDATHLAQDNLVVAVAGDITPKELAAALDKVFGALPARAHLTTIPEAKWPKEPSSVLVKRDGTQTALLFAMPGPKRDDPDWYATEIANYILGGGGFSSRLMHDVRDEKGLTYGISTGLAPMEHGAFIMGETATDNPKTAKAWNVTQDTMEKFYADGATDQEIEAAKDYLTGSLPLTMTSRGRMAEALLGMQLDHLGRDYLDRHDALIRNVTKDEVNQAIRKWFNPADISFSMVGAPEDVTADHIMPLVND